MLSVGKTSSVSNLHTGLVLLLLLLSRLFYLYQGTRMTWIKEETLFTVLSWLSPVITGIAITICMCEGFYRSRDAPILVFYWKVPTRITFFFETR